MVAGVSWLLSGRLAGTAAQGRSVARWLAGVAWPGLAPVDRWVDDLAATRAGLVSGRRWGSDCPPGLSWPLGGRHVGAGWLGPRVGGFGGCRGRAGVFALGCEVGELACPGTTWARLGGLVWCGRWLGVPSGPVGPPVRSGWVPRSGGAAWGALLAVVALGVWGAVSVGRGRHVTFGAGVQPSGVRPTGSPTRSAHGRGPRLTGSRSSTVTSIDHGRRWP